MKSILKKIRIKALSLIVFAITGSPSYSQKNTLMIKIIWDGKVLMDSSVIRDKALKIDTTKLFHEITEAPYDDNPIKLLFHFSYKNYLFEDSVLCQKNTSVDIEIKPNVKTNICKSSAQIDVYNYLPGGISYIYCMRKLKKRCRWW